MAEEDIRINLIAKVDGLVAELRKIPGVSEQTAKAMAAAYNREYAKMEKDAARASASAAKAARDAAVKTQEAWKGSAERMASLIGGPLADISDSIFDLGERMAGITAGASGLVGVLGGLGAAATAGAFAVSFAAKAVVEFGQSAVEASDRLQALGLLTGAQAVEADQLRDTMQGLSVTTDQLRVELATGSGVVEDTTSLLTGLASAARGAVGSIGELAQSAREIGEAGFNIATLGLPHYLGLFDAIEGVVAEGQEVAKTTAVMVDHTEATKKAAEEANKQATAVRGATSAHQSHATSLRDAEAATRAWVSAQDALVRVLDDAESDQYTAVQRANLAYAERIRLINEAGGDADMVADARRAAEERLARDLAAVDMAEAERRRKADDDRVAEARELEAELLAVRREGEEAQRAVEDETAARREEAMRTLQQAAMSAAFELSAAAQQGLDMLSEGARARMEAAQGAIDLASEEAAVQREAAWLAYNTGQQSMQQTQQQLAAIEEEERLRVQVAARQEAAAKAAMTRAFYAQKAIKIAEAIANAAVGYVALTTAMAYLGPGAPAAAAAVMTPVLTAQVALIAAQKPPQFATGGMVSGDAAAADHRMIMASPGEAVLTPRGVQAMGGPDGVQRANRGEGAASDMTAVYLDGSLIGAAVRETMRSDRATLREVRRSSGVVPGRRRR